MPISAPISAVYELVGNATEDDVWVNRAAAVKTVRDYFTWVRGRERMN